MGKFGFGILRRATDYFPVVVGFGILRRSTDYFPVVVGFGILRRSTTYTPSRSHRYVKRLTSLRVVHVGVRF